MSNSLFRIIISLITILLGSNFVFAGTANLSWNPNNESDLAGYKIYYGTTSRTGSCPTGGYPNVINTGNVNSYTVPNLTAGQTYYFSISAYDISNNESCFSLEVSKIIPSTASTNISNVKFIPIIEGTTDISGRNFTLTIFSAGSATQIAQFMVQPDTSGKLLLPTTVSMQSGTYDIFVSTLNYLKKKMSAVNLNSDSSITLPVLRAGDFNNDNVINSLDWSLMSPKWFSQDPAVDVNKDNIVNSIDFSLLNKNWASVGD